MGALKYGTLSAVSFTTASPSQACRNVDTSAPAHGSHGTPGRQAAAASGPPRSGPLVTRSAPISFHIADTTLTLPFSADSARGLDAAIASLLQTFKDKEKAARPQRWQAMDFRAVTEAEGDSVVLEAFCNPNAYSNAFQAKVLITVEDKLLKLTSEGQLSAIKADVDQYLDSHQ
eukprot:SM000008S22309  [mRNA]  locus=s8:945909:947579:- [translate_table: standard]